MVNLKKDYRKFALSKGVHGSCLDSADRELNNSIIPYILEERTLNVASFDIFSRLLFDRILYFSGEVTPEKCDVVNSELLYLASIEDRDISMYINSPGGDCYAGLAICDTMTYVKPSVSTICIGLAASMGAVLLSNGEKGKRFILPNSRVMIHTASGGTSGKTADVEIQYTEQKKVESDIFKLLSKNCDKTEVNLRKVCRNDYWMCGEEAIKFGIADKLLTKQE